MTTVEAGGSARPFRVLLIDNRPERRELMRHLVAATGLAASDVAEAATLVEATAVLDRGDREVVVMEIQLPVTLGLAIVAALRSRWPALRIVVCSFHRDEATKTRALVEGADAYLDKPVSLVSLQAVLRMFASQSSSAPGAAPPEPASPVSAAGGLMDA